MSYVLTVDQIASRHHNDAVPSTMWALAAEFSHVPMTRTVGDEFQLLLTDAVSVVDVILSLMREGTWHVGVGIGAVETPTPRDLREARGPAFLAARRAVEEAKQRADHLRIVGHEAAEPASHDAEVLFGLILALRSRRSPAGWAAADLADRGLTQAEIGERLGVTRQAVNQRLQAAQWSLDAEARPLAARMLDRTERIATGTQEDAS